MIPPLKEQRVVVTGGAKGIGAAMVRAFLDAGAFVTVIDLDEEALTNLRNQYPGNLETAAVDVADAEAVDTFAAGREIDHLVCAAAVSSGKSGFPFWKMTPSDWKRVIDVTLMGTVNPVYAFVPGLLAGETSRKSILLLASIAGQTGSQTDPPYSASKAAVINFAQCAAKDFAPYGIRVNTLSPGMVRTALNEAVYAANRSDDSITFEEWAAEKVRRTAPLGRMQEPEEFGAMAVFLAGEYGRNITGQTINIDGGQVMHA